MGIFDDAQVFKTYRTEIVVRGRLVGGTPKDPKIVERWLRAKTGVSDEEELLKMTERTLAELGRQSSTFEDMEEASEKIANLKQTMGFKVGEKGLYIEARQVKAMLKECTNIYFEGVKWGKRKKATGEGETAGKLARNYLAERVFVAPDKIWLGVSEPSGIDTFIGHVIGPRGPQSTLAYYEYVDSPRLAFDVQVLNDSIKSEDWPMIWITAQSNGLGAMRSQGFGTFDIVKWEAT